MIDITYYEDDRRHPTLMIRSESPDDMSALSNVFARLTDGTIDSADITQLAQVRADGIASIRLTVGPDDLSPFRMSRVEFDPARPTWFAWTEARDVWMDYVHMLEPLIMPNGAGHQYFVDGDRYDLTILVERTSPTSKAPGVED